MKQFLSNPYDILTTMNQIEEFCDVTLVSEDDEMILAHKVVLASASKIFRDMLRTYEKDKDHPVISMKGVKSKFINAMVDLIYHGETEVKQSECDEFMNLLIEYRVATKESSTKDKEDTTSKTQYKEKNNIHSDKNCIKQLEDEIKHQKDDILKFQTTFTMMKREIYSLRAENKELKDIKYKSTENSKNYIVTEKKESETQTEPILQEGESKGYASYGILKLSDIKCRYFYKGKGCKRGDRCWFSHIETVCHYWLEGKCRYSENFCKSRHNKEE